MISIIVKMFRINDASPLQLPNELLLFITKSLDDINCLSLVLSEAFQGFASFYDSKWKCKHNHVPTKYKTINYSNTYK